MIRWATFKKMVMLEQTLFGLTWVVAAIILPFSQASFRQNFAWEDPWRFIAILVAFCAARTAGMAFNRLIDRDIDAENPRTRNRVLPSGEASIGQVRTTAFVGSLVFVLSCALLSQALFYLSPVLLTLIWGYAYTKRVTALCHFVMGLISGLAPVCAWLALVGTWDLAPVLMGLALLCSIAAMDIVYALQDYAHDRAHGIHSVPVALGQEGAVWLARGLHVLTVVLLTWMGLELELPSIYFVGTAAVGVLLLYHHQAIQPERGQLIYSVFFACNARVGLLVLATVIGVLVWDVMLSA